MTRILALAGSKGGAGKSTIAVNLAAEWRAQGRRVVLFDADPQGTSLTWAEVASELGHDCPPVVAVGDNLRQAIPSLAEGYDLAIIDTAGRQSRRLVGALALADLALLPCGPGTADVWALGQSLEAVEQVQTIRPELRAAIVINQQTRTVLGRELRGSLEELSAPTLATSLGSRVAFAEAMAAGQGVTDYASGTVAAHEIRKLANELADLLEIEEGTALHA